MKRIALAVALAACTRSGAESEMPPAPSAAPSGPVTGGDAATVAVAAPARMDAMSPPSSTSPAIDRVRAHLGADYELTPATWTGPAAVALFRARKPAGPPGNVLGVAASAAAVATGEDGMRLVIAETRDAIALAEAAALLLSHDVRVVVDPKALAGKIAGDLRAVTAPTLAGGTLTFWARGGSRGGELMRVTVELSSLAVQVADLDEAAPAKAGDPVDAAIALTRSPSRFDQRSGVEQLAASCARSERARAALEQAATSVANVDARGLAVTSLATCAGPDTVRVLGDVLAKDRDAPVRIKAAQTLAKIGNPAARPALEAAMNGDKDSAVRTAARGALSKLDGT